MADATQPGQQASVRRLAHAVSNALSRSGLEDLCRDSNGSPIQADWSWCFHGDRMPGAEGPRGFPGQARCPPTSPDDLPPADPGLIPLTVAEIKRLFNLLTRTWQATRHYLHWSW